MKIIATNRKAYFDYEVLDTLETGIVLNGAEIKSIRQGQVNLKGSYVFIKKNELWVKDLRISLYQFCSDKNIDPMRQRKLLATGKEIQKIIALTNEQNIVLAPLELYLNQQGYAKLKIGLLKHRKKYDKRAVIKQRDIEKRIAQRLKK